MATFRVRHQILERIRVDKVPKDCLNTIAREESLTAASCGAP